VSQEWNDLIDTRHDDSADQLRERQIQLRQMPIEEVGLLLESLPVEQRLADWRLLDEPERFDVLLAMRADPRERILDDLSKDELDELLTDLDASELLELADSLSGRLIDRAFKRMDEQQQEWFLSARQYDDDLIGHWLSHEILTLPQTAKVRDVHRLLRRQHPEYRDAVFLTNRVGQYAGTVRLSDVWREQDHIPLADLISEGVEPLVANDRVQEASGRIQSARLAALPVVDEQGKLLGCLDMTTALELLQEFYEAQLMAGAGMDNEEDLFAPVRKSAKGRAIWLGINLLTAFAASWFIGLFEATLQEVVALAVLMPVVASMGGIAGSQTLTLMIRGLALNQITPANRMALLRKELSVGSLNGVIWAVVIGLVATVWFGSSLIGMVIAAAIAMNIVAAAFSGVVIPVILDRLKIDPALSGSVVLTTVTDIVGFVAFLGLGTLILL